MEERRKQVDLLSKAQYNLQFDCLMTINKLCKEQLGTTTQLMELTQLQTGEFEFSTVRYTKAINTVVI